MNPVVDLYTLNSLNLKAASVLAVCQLALASQPWDMDKAEKPPHLRPSSCSFFFIFLPTFCLFSVIFYWAF